MIPAASPIIGAAERSAVDRVLRSGFVTQGPEVAAFEEEFARIVRDRECVAVSSGTSALHLGLLAAGIGPGDEVLIPSFTFAATANSVVLAGATPVFVDIDPVTYCIDPDAAASAITRRTAAVMPVHLYGHPADMTAFRRICAGHGLLLIEDAAQAHMARWADEPAGSLGDVAAFSFYPTKNMTSGEGGMVVTADPEVARAVRLLRNQGMERRYGNELVGFNARMTDIHAAIGRVQLAKLPGWTLRRQANAAVLNAALVGVPGITPPTVRSEATHVYHQYTIRVCDGRRDTLVRRLRQCGIGASVYYPIPSHALPSFDLDLHLVETAAATREVVSIPVHPALTMEDLAQISDAILQSIAVI